MGGCCSSSSKRAEPPVYYHRSQELEEHEPLASIHDAVSAGLLVDTNLETSIPDTYRAPPTPLPYDVVLACSQTMPENYENCGNKSDSMQPTDSQPLGETVCGDRFDPFDTCGELKEPDCKNKTDYGHDSSKVKEIEPSKLSEAVASLMDEEDVCPTCFEEYDVENPRIITKCEHHFHLSCILEWMERSDTCPICDQIMIFNNTFDE